VEVVLSEILDLVDVGSGNGQRHREKRYDDKAAFEIHHIS